MSPRRGRPVSSRRSEQAKAAQIAYAGAVLAWDRRPDKENNRRAAWVGNRGEAAAEDKGTGNLHKPRVAEEGPRLESKKAQRVDCALTAAKAPRETDPTVVKVRAKGSSGGGGLLPEAGSIRSGSSRRTHPKQPARKTPRTRSHTRARATRGPRLRSRWYHLRRPR